MCSNGNHLTCLQTQKLGHRTLFPLSSSFRCTMLISNSHCSLQTVHCTVDTVLSSLYTVSSSLYNVDCCTHCSLNTLNAHVTVLYAFCGRSKQQHFELLAVFMNLLFLLLKAKTWQKCEELVPDQEEEGHGHELWRNHWKGSEWDTVANTERWRGEQMDKVGRG